MKNGTMIVGLIAGLVIGGSVGWRMASVRAANNCAFFLSGMATSEISAQEMASAEAYLTRSPDVALWALNNLLRTYRRYADIPETDAGEWTSRLRFASAMALVVIANGDRGENDRRSTPACS